MPNLNVEGRCEERFLEDALHKKVRSISSSVQEMDKEFKLLHENKLSPSPRVLKEYKDLIETTEEKVSSEENGMPYVQSHVVVYIEGIKLLCVAAKP